MKKKGFTLVEIMIVVAIIALLAAIAIPNLLRARLQTNESAAQAALKTLATAEITYRTANATYGTLSQLGDATPPYIDDTLAGGTKNGYRFAINGPAAEEFTATAIPDAQGTSGIRKFCITEDGVVRVNAAVAAATNHATCQGYGATSP